MTDRTRSSEQAIGERTIDDGDRHGAGAVLAREGAPLEQRDAHRGEVVVHAAAHFGLGQRALGCVASLDGDRGGDVRAAERQTRRAADRPHAGDRFEPREQRLVVGEAARRSVVGVRDVHLQRQQRLRAESRVDVQQRDEAANQEPGADGENDRQRDFGDDERRTRATCRLRAHGSASRVSKRAGELEAGRGQRRDCADDETGRQRRGSREHQDSAVDRDGVEARQIDRSQRQKSRHAPACDREGGQAAGKSEHQAFNQRLLNESPAPGAERETHGHFTLSRHAACEEQVRHVHAGQRQEEDDAGEQHEQRRAYAAHRLIEERRHRGAPARVGRRPGLFELTCRRFELRPCGFDTCLRLQSRHGGEHADAAVVAAGVDEAIALEGERQPDVDVGGAAEARWSEHRSVGEDEVGRHHADDVGPPQRRTGVHRRHLIDERQDAADDAGVAAEPPLPIPVAEDHDPAGLAAGKGSAERGCSSEQREHAGGDDRALRDFHAACGLDALGQEEGVHRLDALERARAVPIVDEVGRGDRDSAAAARACYRSTASPGDRAHGRGAAAAELRARPRRSRWWRRGRARAQ